MERIALVTGAYRGLGHEVTSELAKRGYRVLLTSRKASDGEAAAEGLRRTGGHVDYHPLDVSDPKSIQTLCHFVDERYQGRIDVLVNNAGILIDHPTPGKFSGTSALEIPIEKIQETFLTNTLGPYQLCQRFLPGMKERGYGRVVNVSSGMGQLEEMDAGYPAYRISNTALNAVTKIFSEEVKGSNILINSVCPGWVRTTMGGENAPRTLAQGADTIVWLATLEDNGPTGSFFRDRKKIAW